MALSLCLFRRLLYFKEPVELGVGDAPRRLVRYSFSLPTRQPFLNPMAKKVAVQQTPSVDISSRR